MDEFIELIDLLEDNKKFPYYAAERRADLFFAYFIQEMLFDFYGEKVLFVAPEFPIKHDGNNQSNKADLLCVFEKTSQPIIVEIKTDRKSFKKSQLDAYIKSIPSWADIVAGIVSMTKNKNTNTDYRLKYFHLLQRLESCHLVTYDHPNALQLSDEINQLKKTNLPSKKGKRSRLIIELVDQLSVGKWSKEIKLLYVLPTEIIDPTAGCDILEFGNIEVNESKGKPYQKFVKFLKNI